MAGQPLRVAFAGTPEFAATALQAILDAGFAVPLVLTQPDRPAGRGMKLTPSAVKALAVAHGVPVAQPRSLRLDGKYADDAEAGHQALLQAAPDVLVVAAYGLILPQWVLSLPRLGCLNIHASLLPRWRGAAPIHRAIEAGDAETGITIMQMDAGLDTGDMLSMGREAILANDTTASLHDRLARLGGQMIMTALHLAAEVGQAPATPQPEQGICYAHKIAKAESAIDWTLPATVIERRVRAFDPFPGASFQCEGEAVKLWQARALPLSPAAPGTVLRADVQGLQVACGEGALELLQLQRPGGKRLAAAAFVQARPGLLGQVLAASTDLPT
jgi:methionyl-tRNA formyltransferase